MRMYVPSTIPSDVLSSNLPILSDVQSDVQSSAVPSVSYVSSDAASSEVPSESSAIIEVYLQYTFSSIQATC